MLNAWLVKYNNQEFPPAPWNEVCQMLVDVGDYRLAWIGRVAENGSYKSMIQDRDNCGYNSIVVLPLAYESRWLGVLFIYAAEPEAFVEQEIRSLILLSGCIAQKLG